MKKKVNGDYYQQIVESRVALAGGREKFQKVRIIFANNAKIRVSNGVVFGHNNTIVGVCNVIFGDFNYVKGDLEHVYGDFNYIYGQRNRVYGDKNESVDVLNWRDEKK